jgi:hypothetical protein
MFQNDLVVEALAALEAATCGRSYRAAKCKVAKLDRVGQLAMIDSVRVTRARLITLGVL